tara:strand:+ start:809 stop:1738 length:930 start_codon:yes stop_codon:yes gene_type:complete
MSNQKNLTIFRVFGGVGNQIFQYAYARSLSLSSKKKLVLDLSFYKNSLIDYKRLKMAPSKYVLNNFKISKEIKIIKNCYTYSYPFYKYFLQYMPNFIKNFFFNTYKFKIQKFVFEKLLFHKKKMNIKNEKNKTSYYLGYWQSIKYFKKIEKILKNDLQIKNIRPAVNNFIKSIKSNIVAIHVRGGDSIIDHSTKLPKNNYYYKIIKRLKKKIPNLQIHFFSNDLVYLNQIIASLNIKNYKIISKSNRFKDFEEFTIMQNYKYLIISNSSFSWWAGWLSKKPDCKIFAPKIWFDNKNFPKELIYKNLTLV